MKQGVLCSDIYKVLSAPSTGYSITMFDTAGAGTIDPAQAKWFYIKPDNYMIQAPSDDSNEKPEVYLWKSSDIENEQSLDMIERLKHVSNQYGYGFTVYDFGSGNLPKKFSHLAMRNIEQQKVNEGRMSGSSTRSYYTLPRARMIVVHSSRIQEEIHGSRTRNIKEVFVECNGERHRMGTNNLNAARAMTRHLSEGGSWGDKFSKHVQQYSTDLELLKGLLSELEIGGRTTQANKTKQFIQNIKQYLKRASTSRGYKSSLDELPSLPRVGNTHVLELTKRLSPLSSSAPQLSAFARHHLNHSCSNAGDYLETLRQNLMELTPETAKNAQKSVRSICLGTVPMDFSTSSTAIEEGFLIKAAQAAMNGVKNLVEDEADCDQAGMIVGVVAMADTLLNYCQDDLICQALQNITDKPHVLPQDARLVLALNDSCTGVLPVQSVLTADTESVPGEQEVPELKELKDWIDGLDSF